MTTTPPPQTKAYLLQSRANSFFAVGDLELTDTTLRCRVTGHAGWIAKELGIPDLKERLAAGESITAFEFPRDGVKIKWLKQFMGAGFQVSHGDGKEWIVSLIYPSGFLALLETFEARSARKQWRAALPAS
ncbi:hypothetical protein Mycsm_01723 [Mycobacterium sp. JS623]|uniref:hypothetical protein n=1 Tax=Mycobacterium sp. JS623 TaxID=212767 RepID=UPI0002A57D8F|nr:hypothetical protein [Mycobacterium sp. JS623]AGB22118.1 hypothetical protein Mycsm_01723 [Mycobacterium sp. JS623]